MQLTGIGTAAFIEITPPSFEFELVIGQSGAGTLSIGNDGNINLDWNIAAESECGAGAGGEWLSTEPQADTTAPQDSTDVQLTASAAELVAGQYDTVLCVSSNAVGAPEVGVPVLLTVTAPDLSFDPPELDFGNVEIDTTSTPLTASLHNGGDADATALDFFVPASFNADADDCGNSLPAGESCQLAVTFTSDGIGVFDGTLIVDSAEGAVAELELVGNGVEPGALGTDPDHLGFEDVVITRTRTLPFNIVNTGGTGVELASVALESGGPAFVIVGIGCAAGTVLDPGESCVVEISFTPQQVAVHEGAVSITSDEGQQVTVDLSGTVLPDEILADRFEAETLQ